jgi:RHS repeat-associated protein
MPMSERYYTVDGQMVGYEEGGVRKDFLTDHLGSIIAIMDENEVRVFDTRYSAYGRNRWITGTSCGFGWVGSYGYRETSLFHMSHYVRARHYSYLTGSWSSVDPLWPDESAFEYVEGRASRWIDPTGLQGSKPPKRIPPPPPAGLRCDKPSKAYVNGLCNSCKSKPKAEQTNCRKLCDFLQRELAYACGKPRPKPGPINLLDPPVPPKPALCEDCRSAAQSCQQAGWGKENYNDPWGPTWSPNKCKDCCDQKSPSCRSQCNSRCDDTTAIKWCGLLGGVLKECIAPFYEIGPK